MKFFDKTWKLALSGAVAGLLVALLAIYGNPANMAICVACFIRDSAGALKLHTAAPVQYFRPEIVGLCLRLVPARPADEGIQVHRRFFADGALYPRRRDDDWRARIPRRPLRMVLRMSAGDLNAWVALIGFAGGVATGSFFLKKGFSLGRAYEAKPLSGAVLPVLLAALLVVGTATGVYCHERRRPRSQACAVYLSLVAALIIGALAQKSRMCFAGSIRDVLLMKNFDLISIIAALFAVMAVYNLAAGSFHLGFSGSADRAFSAPLEHSRHVRCRLCGCSGWRLSAASAYSGRSGLVRQRP